MASVIKVKVKGNTILETLVALTILLIAFGISITLFVQVNLNSMSEKKILASELLSHYVYTTKKEGTFFDDEQIVSDFLLKKKVLAHNYNIHLLHIIYTISDSNGKVIKMLDELTLNRLRND